MEKQNIYREHQKIIRRLSQKSENSLEELEIELRKLHIFEHKMNSKCGKSARPESIKRKAREIHLPYSLKRRF